jgi:hypothetical protein
MAKEIEASYRTQNQSEVPSMKFRQWKNIPTKDSIAMKERSQPMKNLPSLGCHFSLPVCSAPLTTVRIWGEADLQLPPISILVCTHTLPGMPPPTQLLPIPPGTLPHPLTVHRCHPLCLLPPAPEIKTPSQSTVRSLTPLSSSQADRRLTGGVRLTRRRLRSARLESQFIEHVVTGLPLCSHRTA